ncbi:unnamed protein product [Phytomonas sp. EM1]|nr:unnamed protein product [Phytomonas sp. EM1]|eukprot:CCW62491.1 unnamed protein product [Phytomonas sp. isolate EM1]
MAKLLRAYEVLSDERKRELYDQTGVIPGDPLNPRGYSVDEIFDHFHQPAPIFSKSPTLESVQLLERILAFRGDRLFLFQVYDDGCKACRTLAPVWESFQLSAVVEAGMVEMYRLDAASAEGATLLARLRMKYRGSPIVFSYVDGARWDFHGLKAGLHSGSQSELHRRFQDFVIGFFHAATSKIREIGDNDTNGLLGFLSEPRSAERPMRVLLPRYLSSELIPLALGGRYPGVEICRTPYKLIARLVQHCGLEVDVRNRLGEEVAVPALMVLSTAALPLQGNRSDSLAELASCDGVHVGASVALTFEKASSFVKSFTPPRHAGMGDVPYLDSMSFYEVCKTNCMVWIRRSCSTEPHRPTADPDVPTMVELLKRDYYSFKTGYLCADEHPQLLGRFPELESSRGPVLFALLDSDDAVPWWLSGLSETPARELTAADVDRALSALLSGGEEGPRGAVARAGPRLASLLSPTRFTISTTRAYLHMLAGFDETIGSLIKNFMPFLLMYIVHTWVWNPMNDREAAAARAPRGGERPAASGERRERSSNRIPAFSTADLTDARGGRGFLILLLDERADPGGAMSPSHLASDARFTLRVVGPDHMEWRQWMRETPEGEDRSEANGVDPGLTVLAIRKSKMKAARKPRGQSLDSFLGDLLDGSLSPSENLPSWAFQ